MSEAIRYIGIARKAGAVDIGETNSGAAVRAGKARLLILAADASDNARRRAENFVYGTDTPLVRVPYSKEELTDITGVAGCSMAAFTDTGLASAFMSDLSKNNEGFSEVASQLELLDKKQRKLRTERIAHERNKALGKSNASGKRRKTK